MEKAISKILVDFPQISLVYLFGSQVTGQAGPDSDFDFAIVTDYGQDNIPLQAAFTHAIVMALNIEKVDVVLLDRAPIELAYGVVSDGRLLYARDLATRIEFEAAILNKYLDYLPYLHDFRKQTLEGGAHEKRVQRYREALGRTQRTPGQAGTP